MLFGSVAGLEEILKSSLLWPLIHVNKEFFILQLLKCVDFDVMPAIRIDDKGVGRVLAAVYLLDRGTGTNFRLATAGEIRRRRHNGHCGIPIPRQPTSKLP